MIIPIKGNILEHEVDCVSKEITKKYLENNGLHHVSGMSMTNRK